MANPNEIVIRAADNATRPLREVSREVDVLAARIQQIGGSLAALKVQAASLPSLTRTVAASPRPQFVAEAAGEGGAARTFIPAARGQTVVTSAMGETTVINVMLPDSALATPARAQSAGETFGEAIARRLRERG